MIIHGAVQRKRAVNVVRVYNMCSNRQQQTPSTSLEGDVEGDVHHLEQLVRLPGGSDAEATEENMEEGRMWLRSGARVMNECDTQCLGPGSARSLVASPVHMLRARVHQ